MPTPEALSLEQRGALRWQVPADPQQAGSRPPIGPGVARHASRLRRTDGRGLRGVLFPSPTPATLSGSLSPALPGAHSATSPPAPQWGPPALFLLHPQGTSTPGPQFLLLCAPSALHALESRDPCLAVSPKGPALLAPTDPGSSWGVGISAQKRQTRTTGAEADGRSLPLGPCPMRSRQAGPSRRGWADGGGAAVLKKGPEEAA